MSSKVHGWFHRSLLAVIWLAVGVLPCVGVRAEDAARWYKGSTHCHTLWSDGDEFPEMVADWYKGHGYDFLAISDHDRLMAGEKWIPVAHGTRCTGAAVENCEKRFGAGWLTTRENNGKREVKLKTFDEIRTKLDEPGKFLLVQNEEISAKVGDHHVHMNAINLAEPIAPRIGRNVTDTISVNLASVLEQSARLRRPIVAHVNHPNWSEYDISPEDLAAVTALGFFEVWNAHPGSRNLGDAIHPGTEKAWDIANTIRLAKMKAPPLYGIGSDDAHNYHAFSPQNANPGRAWIMVRAQELKAEPLLDAIDRGDFYVSSGVVLRELKYDAQQRTISVEVQAEPGVRYVIEFIGTLKGTDPTGQAVADDHNLKRPGNEYSPDVGKVLSRVEGASATYRFSGNELYVRAAIRSNKPIANASPGGGQFQQVWGQPMGWKKIIYR
jgi:predicted metal-dependent phosphoesterase TrpH